jgi:transcription initiation factor TFIIIB Brf1 subunit/transcription initiation factor TFIIB
LKDDTGQDKVLGNLELDDEDGGLFYTRIGDGDNQFSRTHAAVEDNSSKKDRAVRKLNAEFCARLGLANDIEVRTMEMYMIISRIKDIKRQKRDDIMVGACLFLVCQKTGRLTLADLCKGTNIDQAKVSRCVMRIRQSADYKKFRKSAESKAVTGGRSAVIGCAQLIPRYVSELFPTSPYRQKINNLAEEVAQKVANDGLADGKKPNTLAGVIIKLVYDWLKEDITWRAYLEPMRINLDSIAKVVEITSVTMQKTFELLEPHRRKLLPAESKGDGPARTLPKTLTDATPKIKFNNVLDTSLLN